MKLIPQVRVIPTWGRMLTIGLALTPSPQCFVFLLVVLTALGASDAKSAVVHPHNLETEGFLIVDPGQSVGQVFVPHISGRLVGIEISPRLAQAAPADVLSLEVVDGFGTSLGAVEMSMEGFPTGTTVPPPLAIDNLGPGFFELTAFEIDLSAHQTYAFFLTKPLGDWIYAGISSDYYPGGAALINEEPSAAHDMVFKVIMAPPPKLLVGAANGQTVKAYDGFTGAALGDFTDGGPFTMGASGIAYGGPFSRLYVEHWNGAQIDEYNGITGEFIRTLVVQSTVATGSNLLIGPEGYLYSSAGTNGIRRWNVDTGALVDVFIPPGSGGLLNAGGMCYGPDDHLYVGNLDYISDKHEVLRYAPESGAFVDVFVPDGSGGLEGPRALTFGCDGHLYVSSYSTDSVLRYDGSSGDFLGVFASGSGLDGPYGLAFGPDQNLYVSAAIPNAVYRFDGHSGGFIDVFASGTHTAPTYVLFAELTIPEPLLHIRHQADHVVVTWCGDGMLSVSVDLPGNQWFALPAAKSPFVPPPGSLPRYYRLVQP